MLGIHATVAGVRNFVQEVQQLVVLDVVMSEQVLLWDFDDRFACGQILHVSAMGGSVFFAKGKERKRRKKE